MEPLWYCCMNWGPILLSVLWQRIIFTARKRSLRKLCFYRWTSVHGGEACMVLGCAWQGGMHDGGHAWRGLVYMLGGCVWQGGMHGGHVWGLACMVGGCVWQGGHARQRGMCGRWHAWQGGICGKGHAWQGACMPCMPPPPHTHTMSYGLSMRGMHTGMHSC